MSISTAESISWTCKSTWKKASVNTLWCLLGCSIGDFGTIFFFQITQIPFPLLWIMSLAIINGLITSIMLETFILSRQMNFGVYWGVLLGILELFYLPEALKTAMGMSFISMIAMELAMNAVDVDFSWRSFSMVGHSVNASCWFS